jgi:hypothetical protein
MEFKKGDKVWYYGSKAVVSRIGARVGTLGLVWIWLTDPKTKEKMEWPVRQETLSKR